MAGTFYAGKTALVTGASSGLGAELARQLAALGANLIITARRRDKLTELAAALRTEHGTRVHVIAGDLGQPGGAAALCGEVDALGLTLDLVINNAGRATANAFVRADLQVEIETLRLNCEAPVIITRHFLPRLVGTPGAGLILVSSVAGMIPIPNMAMYGASKAFLMSFGRALAEELRGTGTRAMTLAPGPFETEFQRVANYELGTFEKLAVIPVAEVARVALKDYAAGKTESFPGAVMSLAKPLIGVSPTALVTRIAGIALKGRR